MNISPKSFEEAIDLVYNILNQGDGRYNDTQNEVLLANFLLKQAIILEKREFPLVQEPKMNIKLTSEVQSFAKELAKQLLNSNGFKDNEIFYERRFRSSRPDLLAENKDRLVLVECYSCRIDKIIDFLSEADEIWVITKGLFPYENENYLKDKAGWFVFKKGKNWKKIYFAYSKKLIEELKKIKSPIDDLMKD